MRFVARFLCLVVLVQLIVACGSRLPAAGPPAALITGTVAAGPITPVARPGEPGTRPVAGARVDAWRGGKVVAAARADAAGRYRLRLRPGSYVIVAMAYRLPFRPGSRAVTLSAGQTLTVSFVLDTGIR